MSPSGTEPPARIDQSWLYDPRLRRVFEALGDNAETVRVNGGAVRDAVLERPIGDIDLCTVFEPDEIVRRIENAGLKAVPTGIEHGTITVVSDHEPYQVTTLREDVETDGRHAVVRFGTDWRRDAERRDLTMNALYLGPDGTLYDPLGGYDDCLGRRVRFIGDPVARIREDYLRILRFFRFHASHGQGPLDADALTAIAAEASGLETISRERIGAEMRKLLPAAGAEPVLEAMRETGTLGHVFPGLAPKPSRLARARHFGERFGLVHDGIALLAPLLAPGDGDGEGYGDGDTSWIGATKDLLRLANEETQVLKKLASPLKLGTLPDPVAARESRYRDGPNLAPQRVQFAWSMAGAAADEAPDGAWSEAMTTALRADIPAFPLTGRDLIAEGVPRGPELGEALRRREEEWIRGGFRLERRPFAEG